MDEIVRFTIKIPSGEILAYLIHRHGDNFSVK